MLNVECVGRKERPNVHSAVSAVQRLVVVVLPLWLDVSINVALTKRFAERERERGGGGGGHKSEAIFY